MLTEAVINNLRSVCRFKSMKAAFVAAELMDTWIRVYVYEEESESQEIH
jgi:hypothetical protein